MVGTLAPAKEYLGLTIALLDSLHGDPDTVETALVQLQALFGPMLVSALQLVDKREVVRVSLPSDRYVYQVSGSGGMPYTLYLNLPNSDLDPASSQPKIISHIPESTDIREPDRDIGGVHSEAITRAANDDVIKLKRIRLQKEVSTLKRLYCPCPGFAYNSLAGDRNVLCKHLLAALIAWKSERGVKTEVPLAAVIDLLNLRSSNATTTASETVKKELST